MTITLIRTDKEKCTGSLFLGFVNAFAMLVRQRRLQWYQTQAGPWSMLHFTRGVMKNEFTAISERDGDRYIAYCPESPGANGPGRTKDEARQSLAEAIELILEDRREDALRGVPPDAIRETVSLK